MRSFLTFTVKMRLFSLFLLLISLQAAAQNSEPLILQPATYDTVDSVRHTPPSAQFDTDAPSTAAHIPSSILEVGADSAALLSLRTDTALNATPVLIGGTTIFSLYDNIGEFTPAQRAKKIQQLVEDIAVTNLQLDSVRVVDGENTSVIFAGSKILASVTNLDAQAEGITRQEMAERNAEALKTAIIELRKDRSLKQILLNVTLAIFLGFVLFYTLKFTRRGLRRLLDWLIDYSSRWGTLSIKKIEFLTPENRDKLIRWLINSFGIIIQLLLIYFFVTTIFSLFIWTRDIGHKLLHFVTDPAKEILLSVAAFIPNLIAIVVIIIIFRYIIRFVNRIFNQVEEGRLQLTGFYPEWAPPTKRLVQLVLIVLAAVIIYPYTPVSQSPAAQGVSIFLGVLITLGSSSAISNIIAGILLTYTRAFRIGDRIKVNELVGDVTERNFLVLRLRTIHNEEISIPNSTLIASNIINYSEAMRRHDTLILHTEITIGYDVPWRLVHDLLIQAALLTHDVCQEPPPYVFQRSLDDFYVAYQLNANTYEARKQARIYSELHAHIQDVFAEAGVEIMSPAYNVNRLNNNSTLPPPPQARPNKEPEEERGPRMPDPEVVPPMGLRPDV